MKNILNAKSVIKFYNDFLAPKSIDENSQRREMILNVLLCGIVLLLVLLNVLLFYHSQSEGAAYEGLSPVLFIFITIPFIFLYWLSRKGYFILASYMLIGLYLAGATWGSYTWGVDLPSSLLGYALLITMASVLISTKFSIGLAIVISIFNIFLGYSQSSMGILPDVHWKNKPSQPGDALEYTIILLLILGISTLSNSELEKSLKRATKSESDLKQERDLLETRVEERTAQLKQAQFEKISQMEKFVEFGKLASGLFHDLANPLTALSISMRQIKTAAGASTEKSEEYLNQAFVVSRKMEDFLVSARKQLQNDELYIQFSLNAEIEGAIEILSFKTRKAKVSIIFEADQEIFTYGQPTKFYQVILNILSNAIEACEEKITESEKDIFINLGLEDNLIKIQVRDCGIGISPEEVDTVFQPFFTTKRSSGSLGLGLSNSKQIITQSFNGTITLASDSNGTLVTLSFPTQQEPLKEWNTVE